MTAATMRYKVGIIGCSIGGPTLALHLLCHPVLRQRYVPILFDRSIDVTSASSWERQQTAGAAVALFPNGLHPLHQLGLKDELDKIGMKSEEMGFYKCAYGEPGVTGTYKHLGTGKTAPSDLMLLAVERQALQNLLVGKVVELGGEVIWGKSLSAVEVTKEGRIKATFNEDEVKELDLLVGADGAFSKVRRFILDIVNPKGAEQRWKPEFFDASGVYGISNNADTNAVPGTTRPASTYGLWLDRGNLSTSDIGVGKIRFDLQVPEQSEPIYTPKSERKTDEPKGDGWESKIIPGVYPRETTISLLERHMSVYHPTAGTFGHLIKNSERIIHAPLQQRIWEANEIQHASGLVLIGDAARAMLPSSGQGTSFAIEDATVLADMLLKHVSYPEESAEKRVEGQQGVQYGTLNDDNDGEKIKSMLWQKALEEYAKARVPRSKQMGQMAWYSGKMALGNTWYWRGVRDVAAWAGAKQMGKDMSKSWPFDARYNVGDSP